MQTTHQKPVTPADSTTYGQRPITDGHSVDGRYPLKPWQAYLVALVMTVATFGLRVAIDGPLGGQPTLVMFTIPIMLSAYVGGLGAGLLATGLSYFLASYYLLPPIHSLQVTSPVERWQQFFVVLTGVIISVVNEALHRSRRRADVAVRESQKARDALVQAGALQSAIFNSTSFSSIATDTKGIIQIFNVGAERMLGYTATDVTNRIALTDFYDPQEMIASAEALSVEFGTPIAPGFEALFFKASRGIEDIYELTNIRKDGSRFPAMISVTALRDAQSVIIGYLLIGTDNTRRRQAEQAQRASEARYSTLFECAPDGIVIADLDSYYIDANESICRMLGYTRAELIGMHASNIVTESEVQHIGAALHQIKTTSEYHREWQFRRKDGSVFDAEVIATQMPDGHLLGMIRDISDRKRAQEQTTKALRELKDVTAAIDEHAIVAITNSKGKITYVNDKFCAISQYSREELLGKDHRIINSKFHPKEFIRNIWQTIGAGRVWRGEIRNRAKDGTFYWVDTTIVPYLDESGIPVQYIAIRADITKRKEFEQALQLKNIELEDTSRMKSEFLANMSHELRTPLNAIIGFSEVLVDGLIGELTDQQRGCITDIFDSGIHLLALINDILDLSKVEAGKMALELESVQLLPLLMHSLAIIRERAGARQIQLTVDVAEELGGMQVDVRKVKQIIYNLLSNAVKFTADGGQVTLYASRVPHADVGQLSDVWAGRNLLLSNLDHGSSDFLKIVIADSGIGISPDGLERLFTPFSQIDSGLARKYEGTGLGLVMVKLLVELHGGAVSVESAVGEGSRFTVWLPFRASSEGAKTQVRTVDAPRIAGLAGSRTALVVEGDFKAADLIRMYLEADGFEVLHAASAEAALALAVQQPLALITLGIMLPNMDGWEFLSRIKQVPGLQRVPVVIISIAADRVRGFALGAAAVMQKPVSRQELYESLVDLRAFPIAPGQTLKVLVVDDDPKAVELMATRLVDMASTVLRAFGGRESIDLARRELPDVIVLDLMMPEVNGFDVVEALNQHPDTERIPILVVTAKQITSEDRAKLSGSVTAIMDKAAFDQERFVAEIRRAMSGREVPA